MADCDKKPLGEAISTKLIPVGCAIMNFFRGLVRPGSAVTAALVVALGVVGLARELDLPKASWWTNAWGKWSFFVLYATTTVLMFIVAIWFRRLLNRPDRQTQFHDAAQGFVTLTADATGLPRNQIGVTIWLVKGMRGFRRLKRAVTVAEPRNPTAIMWTKGKGIIGEAWSRDTIRFADLDDVRGIFRSEADWCLLDRDDRFRLSWREFNETRRYHAVLAVPLRRLRWGKYRVVGVAAIDLLAPDKASELKGIEDRPEFGSIRLTCEAAFAGRSRRDGDQG